MCAKMYRTAFAIFKISEGYLQPQFSRMIQPAAFPLFLLYEMTTGHAVQYACDNGESHSRFSYLPYVEQ